MGPKQGFICKHACYLGLYDRCDGLSLEFEHLKLKFESAKKQNY